MKSMVQKVVLETWETRENGNKSWRSCKCFGSHLFLFFWWNVNMWFGIECNMTHMCQFPVYKRRGGRCLCCWFTFTNPPPALLPMTDWCLCGNFLPQISDHLARRRVLQMHIFADFSGNRTRKQKHRDGSASRRSPRTAAVVSTARSFEERRSTCPVFVMSTPSWPYSWYWRSEQKKDCIGITMETRHMRNFQSADVSFYYNFLEVAVKFPAIKDTVLLWPFAWWQICIFTVKLGLLQSLIGSRRCHIWPPVTPPLLTERTVRGNRGLTDPSSSACISEA